MAQALYPVSYFSRPRRPKRPNVPDVPDVPIVPDTSMAFERLEGAPGAAPHPSANLVLTRRHIVVGGPSAECAKYFK